MPPAMRFSPRGGGATPRGDGGGAHTTVSSTAAVVAAVASNPPHPRSTASVANPSRMTSDMQFDMLPSPPQPYPIASGMPATAPTATLAASAAQPSSTRPSTAVVVAVPIVKPPWVNVEGFTTPTSALQVRLLNPLLDIDAFGSTQHRTRPIDVKGQLGARPVQEWKEMLRCSDVEQDHGLLWNHRFGPWATLPHDIFPVSRTAPPPDSPPPSPRPSPTRRRQRGASATMDSTRDSATALSVSIFTPSTECGVTTACTVVAAPQSRKLVLEGGAGGSFSFWGGRHPEYIPDRGSRGMGKAVGVVAARPRSAPGRTGSSSARGGSTSPAAHARVRRKNVPRYGSEVERRLSLQRRPAWRNIVGPQGPETQSSEHRKLNPLSDINCFGSTLDRTRALDAKGELGARPVQIWKQMLRS